MLTYSIGYLRDDQQSGALGDEDKEQLAQLRMYYTLTPLFVFSMMFVAVANNLGVMWAAIEATTLASIFLVTFYGKVTSLEAAWKYAIIGGVGLSMALFGTLVTYYAGHRLAGSDALAGLNWSVLAQHAAQLDKTSMRLAFVLILMGYGTKAGLAPMHTWKPDAYSEAPVPSAAILSSAMLNCALYGLIRFYILTSRCLGAEYPSHLLLALRTALDGHLRSIHSGAEKSSPPAGLFHHRSWRYHGHSAGARRPARHIGPDAAHDLSHHREIAYSFFARAMCSSTFEPISSLRSKAASSESCRSRALSFSWPCWPSSACRPSASFRASF